MNKQNDTSARGVEMQGMKCPKCGLAIDEDDMQIEAYTDPIEGYAEVCIVCPKGHEYFTRFTIKDLMEV
jgi:hypothetical protein